MIESINFGETTVVPLQALETNYVWLLSRKGRTTAVVVDPSEAPVVERELGRRNWSLSGILCTHHHPDHVGGNIALKNSQGCEVVCSERDRARVPGATRAVREGELFIVGGFRFEAFLIPGHTQGQIAWYLRDDGLLFVGDTVFAFGCGRLFEGSAPELYHSLERIARLPRETRLFFGHEYAETNAAFALSVEPGNKAIQTRLDKIRGEIAKQGFSTPPRLEEELATNPFFRTDQPEIKDRVGLANAPKADVFTRLRQMKDTFRA